MLIVKVNTFYFPVATDNVTLTFIKRSNIPSLDHYLLLKMKGKRQLCNTSGLADQKKKKLIPNLGSIKY